jgi:hypothetical protein
VSLIRALLTGKASDNPSLAIAASEASVIRPTRVFSTDIDSGVLYGTPTFDDYIYGTRNVTRREALKVAPVKRARDLIAGAIGQLPLNLYDANNVLTDWSLLDQPEAGIAPSITWTNVVEDLLFHKVAWLKVTNLAWHGRAADVMRLDPETVTIQKQIISTPFGTAEVWPDVPGIIRIDSPNEGILSAGATAIRAVIRLQNAALNYTDGVPPQDWFEPTDSYDPYEDEDVEELLNDWQERRRRRATGYVPAGLAYKTNNLTALDMQLAEARDFATKEIARLTGIDAEDLSVSTTSRTYQNDQDRRRDRLENVLGPYMTAIWQRLSMDDVTPHGYTAHFDTTGYLRLVDLSAAQTDATLVNAGIVSRNEVRAKRGLAPMEGHDVLAPSPTPAVNTPAPAPIQEPTNG